MRAAFAATLGRLAGTVSRLTGRGATALPGVIGLQLDPRLVEHRAQHLGGSIVVTGTNGKTTTARFIAALLAQGGHPVIHNQAGSNLLRGLASSLIASKPDADTWGLFEVDEATIPAACDQLQPRIVLITNLFRDQLDRYGELKRTADYLRTGLQQLPADSIVILNADDPLVAGLGAGLRQRVLYYGIEDASVGGTELPHAADSLSTADGRLLEYDRVYVGHLGHYAAPRVTRPRPDVSADQIQLHGLTGTGLKISAGGRTASTSLTLPGLYNVYNALAAAAVGTALEMTPSDIAPALEQTAAAFGRTERIVVDGKQVFVGLIKNPTGANELASTLAGEAGQKHFLILINDNFADGRDVSWLWDADFEKLLPSVRTVSVGGRRAADMALRLKYAGLSPEKLTVTPDIATAFQQTMSALSADETLYVLPTYTAMLELRRILSRSGHVASTLE